jgi:hypothetical protein
MATKVSTVKVKTEGFDDPIVINEEDFDETIHTRVEDAKEKPSQGHLPEDFPGYSALEAAGITTFAQLRKVDDLVSVPGIGEATAAKIADALK